MKTNHSLHGLVLAGGRSCRMGQDKAGLVHPDGRSLARRCHDLLKQAGCESVAISIRSDQEIPTGLEGVEIVRDPPGESLGPIVGMVAGMRLHPNSNWLVVACDLPRLDTLTLTHLVDSRLDGENFLAYRSEFDGLPEPLCTLYSPGALRLLEQAQAEDFRCPRKILIRGECRLLEPITPRALENANTPEDWATAISQ
jgi:molybdopterin-guanine dinucleotide biosynthesis protein A